MPGNHRRVILVAALAAVRVKSHEPELFLVHALLDSWRGLGLITAGMRGTATTRHSPATRAAGARPSFTGAISCSRGLARSSVGGRLLGKPCRRPRGGR